jgi:hypothetical protein
MSNKVKAPSLIEGLMNLLNQGYLYNPSANIFNRGKRDLRKPANYIHRSRKGPGRSRGVNTLARSTVSGVKLTDRIHEGRLGIRGRVLSGASLLAQQGKL